MIKHDLKERRYIVRMLYSELSDFTKKVSLDRRIYTIEVIVAFCRVRKALRQKRLKLYRD